VLILLAYEGKAQVHELDDNLPADNEALEEWRALQSSQQSMSALLRQADVIGQLLSAKQIAQLQEHLGNTGEMLDLYELQSLDEFSYVDLQRLAAWVTIKNERIEKSQVQIKHRSIYASRADGQYSEQPFSHYQQIRFTGSAFRCGLAREIDMGEAFARPMRFDHHAAFIEHVGQKSHSIVGNFKKFQGQGLLLAQGFSRTNLRSNRIQLNPGNWASGMADNTEYNYFQGIYHQQSFGTGLRVEAYYSNIAIDKGNTGLHRTATERRNANSIRQEVSGFGVEKQLGKGLGTVAILRSGTRMFMDLQWQQNFRNKFIVLQLAQGSGTLVALAGFNALLDAKREVAMQIAMVQNTQPSPWQSFSSKASTGMSIKGNWVKQDSKTNFRAFFCSIYLESVPAKFNTGKSVEIQPEYLQQFRIARQSIITFRIKQKVVIDDEGNKRETGYCWLGFTQQATEKLQLEQQVHLKYEGELRMYQSFRALYKRNNMAAFVALARIQASSQIPLYYSDQNFVMPGSQVAFFRSAWLQSVGLRVRVYKGLSIQSSAQFFDMQKNEGIQHRVYIQIIYRG
jgi:hypothetical protein